MKNNKFIKYIHAFYNTLYIKINTTNTSHIPSFLSYVTLAHIWFWNFNVGPLLEGDAYFKARKIIQMKSQLLVIFSFQMTINTYHYDVLPYKFQN